MSLRARYNPINYTNLAGKIDHGLLLGLTDNDHVQYVNAVSDTASIDLTLTGQSIRGDVIPAGINHSAISQLAWSLSGHEIDDDLNIPSDIQIVFGSQAETSMWYNDFQDRLQIDVSSNGYYLYIIGDTETTGDIFLPDDKHIAFGNTSGSPDASIEWVSASNYLDIQSADTRFSGKIDIPTTTSTAGQITQNGGTLNLINTFGTENIFMGSGSGGNFTLTVATAIRNVGIGTNTLMSTTSGGYNMAIGAESLTSNTTGIGNVGIGYKTLEANQTGNSNIAIGSQALKSQVGTYTGNIAIGDQAMLNYKLGSYNTAIGYNALLGTTASSGGYNVAMGVRSLWKITSGGYNIGLGYYSGGKATSGAWNLFLGTYSGYNENGSNNIFIGSYSGYNQTASNLFIVDSVTSQRADIATEQSNSILYGVMAASPASQTLTINADTTISRDLRFTTSLDSAAVADEVSLGCYELSAGNRALAISQESAVAVDTDETKFSHKLPVRINGSTYYIMLTAT